MLASECQYSNNDWLKHMAEEEDEIINYVHEDIPSHTAEILGVRSLTDELLNDTEGIQPCGQHEDIACRIKGLLDGYTDGLSVPKEIIQNADDAGAKKVCFLYDERENLDARTRLLDENMEGFQGPALWAYNNAQFTPQDLRNITKLGGATKLEDETKVGKFGLGFCSVYNLTDVPSFVTGSDIVIFDPHYKYLGQAVKGHEPGIKINLNSVQNQKLVRRMKNQFMPFNGVFGCDLRIGHGPAIFDGTLFRLPLRTKEQAASSEIKNTAYSPIQIRELLRMLMENGGNILLFTQNVTEIEIYHLPANAVNPTEKHLVFQASKTVMNRSPLKVPTSQKLSSQFNILTDLSQIFSHAIRSQSNLSAKSIFANIDIKVQQCAECFTCAPEKSQEVSTQWIISYATGSSNSLELSKRGQAKGVLPLAGIAIPIEMEDSTVKLRSLCNTPLGFYKTGHYFSFLPLPIPTQMPVHINATFAVAPDRRSIMWGTEDDKTDLFKPQWNAALMVDAVPNAYIALLESLKNCNVESDEDYWNLWPLNPTGNELQCMGNAFLRKVVFENLEVFKRCELWTTFESCFFVDSQLLASDVGDIVFRGSIQFLENKKRKLMKLQDNLKMSFLKAGLECKIQRRTLSTEYFLTKVFFPEIHSLFWHPRDRNKLVLFAVDSNNDTIVEYLQQSRCIPSEPTGELKRPCEMIHPESSLKDLFNKSDGRYVHSEMDIEDTKERKENLGHIGMIVDYLPRELVLDRVRSISDLSQFCSVCALERSAKILVYIEKRCMSDANLIEELKKLAFLPIMQKPMDWTLPWKEVDPRMNCVRGECTKRYPKCSHKSANTHQFASPRSLYLMSTQSLVSTEAPILDESCYKHQNGLSEDFYSRLGVKGAKRNGLLQVPIKIACRQLIHFCVSSCDRTTDRPAQQQLTNVCDEIYSYLHQRIQHETVSEEEYEHISNLSEHPVVFLGDVFVLPSQTALNISIACEPLLFGLQKQHLGIQCKGLAVCLGIKDQFTVDDILQVIVNEKNNGKGEKLTAERLKLIINLMRLLVDAMERQTIDCEELQVIQKDHYGDTQMYLPGNDNLLHPVDELCIDDNSEIEMSGSMQFVNSKIPPYDAGKLGVKSKEKQLFQDNSEPFGPNEDLSTRIKNILKGYPCNERILKELLQNADDAHGTEINFITDFSTHSKGNVFDDRWKPLQGPALLVYNNSAFSKTDFRGIQDLGIGSKGEDPTKTGQYGVGFNAVYHLTDAPSFITKGPDVEGGDTMCIMDPYRQYLSNATTKRPGIRLTNLNSHRARYPDVFTCYHEDKILDREGTVFRFPLRTENHDKSTCHLSNPMPECSLKQLLQSFEKEMLEALLFVNSMKKISVSDITSGNLSTKYSVEAVISDEDEANRTEFANHVKDFSRRLKEDQDVSNLGSHSVSYKITIKDNREYSKTWLVVQHIGFGDSIIPDEVISAYRRGDLGLLPRGGVAVLLSEKYPQRQYSKQKDYKAFCFLPLPLCTGLPAHINGHFALAGEARSNLWNEEYGGYRWMWNKLLLTRIASVYVVGMEKIKEMYLDGEADVKSIEHLDDVFPNFIDAKDSNWKFLVVEIFQEIYGNHHELFHVTFTNVCGEEKKTPSTRFVSLYHPNERFPAVFNRLLTQFDCSIYNRIKTVDRLEKINKTLGLRLLDTPNRIFDSMKAAKIPVEEITPDFLLDFLKSFAIPLISHKCNLVLQEGGTVIAQTSLHDINGVLDVLSYCKNSEKFTATIAGAPLCLTEDGKLHVFQENNAIFCSRHQTILPKSSMQFIHRRLVPILDQDDLQRTIFKPFNVKSFAALLPQNLSSETYRNPDAMPKWKPDCITFLNKTWLKNVWSFFRKQLRKHMPENEEDRAAYISQQLEAVASWNLVPCTLTAANQDDIHVLMSIEAVGKILNLESFKGCLKETMEKLEVPVFDTTILEKEAPVCSILPTFDQPCLVMNCLYLHCQHLLGQQLTSSDCYEITEYFASNFKELQTDRNWMMKLRSLPLHITVHDDKVSLDFDCKVFVSPPGIPQDGIQIWAHRSGIVLLKEMSKLQPIYNRLGITAHSLCHIYAQAILARIDCLPRKDILKHFEFIRDHLLITRRNMKFSTEQQHLIAALARLEVFDTGTGIMMKASELYSPHVPLMDAMCEPDQLPPSPFNESEWKTFMELIGMTSKASNQMLIKFAHQIQHDGMSRISGKVLDNSNLLLDYILLFHIKDRKLLQAISTITFIVPYKIIPELEDIFPQHEAEKLVAFRGAVPSKFHRYVWSNSNILPELVDKYFDDEDVLAKVLHVWFEQPPLESMIQHTQNVCDALKTQCERGDWEGRNGEFLTNLLSDIYEALWKYGSQEKTIISQRLYHSPIAYLPTEHKYVTCRTLVIGLPRSGIINKYLYPAPDVFGRYYPLFELLGAVQTVNSQTYAKVLENLHRDVKDEVLDANELMSTSKALDGLFLHLPSQIEKDEDQKVHDCLDVKVLYLPTTDRKLVNSKKIIYCNSTFLYEKISCEAGLHFFMPFYKLQLPVFDDSHIRRLPHTYRPQLLTEVVTRQINRTNLEIIHGHYSKKLQEFIYSSAFLEGILRLEQHAARGRQQQPYCKETDERILSSLQGIQVLQVRDLKLDILYQGRTVGCQNVMSRFEKEKNEQKEVMWKFYVEVPNEVRMSVWLINIASNLTKLIWRCTGIDGSVHDVMMLKMLITMEDSCSISTVLDREDIPAYCMTEDLIESVFPPCGTVVNPEFFFMLDNTTIMFDPSEFVALELVDEDSYQGEEGSVYIYVKILEKMPPDVEGVLSREYTKYKVDVGDGKTVIRCAYEIYKFLRKNTRVLDLVGTAAIGNRGVTDRRSLTAFLQDVPNEESDGSSSKRPLEAIFHEVREKLIAVYALPPREKTLNFKRYLRDWHPDKNIGKEDIATKVFQYIQFIWDKLTRGESVHVDEDDTHCAEFTHPPPSPNRDFYEDIYRQCFRERQQYESAGSSRGFHRAHTAPVSNPLARKKWFRQAKYDLRASGAFMELADEVEGYNWICYMCHQAAEKALKSMMYMRDANNVNMGHNLCGIASVLADPRLISLTREMQSLLGNHTYMRYPDVYAGDRIPSTSYDKNKAKDALKLATEILREVEAKY